MTCSLALALPGLSLVAADTRISLSVPGVADMVRNDGPMDFRIEVGAGSFETVVAFHSRKIRRIGRAWGTFAGDFLVGRAALSLLAARQAVEFVEARGILLASYPEISHESRMLGFPEAQSRSTAIMVAPFDSGSTWSVLLDVQRGETPTGQFIVNFPPEMADAALAKARFESQLALAVSLPAVVRATAGVIVSAARQASSCGPIVQIGLTVNMREGGVVSRYLSADAAMLQYAADADVLSLLGSAR